MSAGKKANALLHSALLLKHIQNHQFRCLMGKKQTTIMVSSCFKLLKVMLPVIQRVRRYHSPSAHLTSCQLAGSYQIGWETSAACVIKPRLRTAADSFDMHTSVHHNFGPDKQARTTWHIPMPWKLAVLDRHTSLHISISHQAELVYSACKRCAQ